MIGIRLNRANGTKIFATAFRQVDAFDAAAIVYNVAIVSIDIDSVVWTFVDANSARGAFRENAISHLSFLQLFHPRITRIERIKTKN